LVGQFFHIIIAFGGRDFLVVLIKFFKFCGFYDFSKKNFEILAKSKKKTQNFKNLEKLNQKL
jgi:hypothetical protein